MVLNRQDITQLFLTYLDHVITYGKKCYSYFLIIWLSSRPNIQWSMTHMKQKSTRPLTPQRVLTKFETPLWIIWFECQYFMSRLTVFFSKIYNFYQLFNPVFHADFTDSWNCSVWLKMRDLAMFFAKYCCLLQGNLTASWFLLFTQG